MPKSKTPKNKQWCEIKALGNNAIEIYVFDEIGYWGMTSQDFADVLKSHSNISQIDMHINSPGGSVFEGIAIYNLLKNHSANVTAYIDGLAASMASVIAMAADSIVMPENALMMIHNPSSGSYGEADEHRKTADLLDKIKKSLVSSYVARSGKSEDEISEIMDAETWYTGAEAVEAGFADQVTDAIDIAACASFDLKSFDKTPKSIQKIVTPVTKNQSEKPDDQPAGEAKMPKAIKTSSGDADKVTTAKTEVEIRAELVAVETERKSGIRAVFAPFGDAQDKLLSTCLDDMECQAEDAQAKLLAELGKQSQPSGGGFETVIDSGKQADDGKMLTDMETALVARVTGEKAADDNGMRGYTLLEMARMVAQRHNMPMAGFGKMDIVAAAFTHNSGDFGNVLSNVAQKSMLRGYDEAESTFQQWTNTGELSDFKINSRVDLDSFPTLRNVREGAEYKHITLSDRGESAQLATYGELFSITRQAIINDDLRMFTRLPAKMGAAWVRTVNALVYAILNGNPNMSDGVALFHNGTHKNQPTAAAINTAALSAAKVAMRKQKDATGTSLQIRPQFLLVPVELEEAAMKYINSAFDPDASGDEVYNPNRNALEVISDVEMSEGSTSAWYTAAGQNQDTIEVSYLDGNAAPRLEQQAGWSIDGVEFKVAGDAAVTPLNFRTLTKNAGA